MNKVDAITVAHVLQDIAGHIDLNQHTWVAIIATHFLYQQFV